MKRILLFISAVALMLNLPSCKGMLDTTDANNVEQNQHYATFNDADNAILGIYGKLMDTLGIRKKLYMIGLLSMGPCAALIFSSTGAPMYIGLIIMGLVGMGAPAAALASTGPLIHRPEHMGIAMGLIMTLQNAGFFLGALLMPYFLIMTGNNWATTGLILLPIGLLGVGIIAVVKYK